MLKEDPCIWNALTKMQICTHLKGPSIKDVSPEGEGGGTLKRRHGEMGGGTLFRAKETSFLNPYKWFIEQKCFKENLRK